MATPKRYQSFRDHLSLYLPPFLRPSLPRDLRPSPPPLQPLEPRGTPSTPPPSPDRSELQDSTRASADKKGIPGTNPLSLNTECQDPEERGSHKSVKEEEEESSSKSNSQTEEPLMKSREGYQIALILTNSGSVARDHLALERTFLAYVRTSLATASTGVALVQLFTITNSIGTFKSPRQQFVASFATPLGAALILFALIVLFLGCLRYFTVQMALTRGVFPAARLTVTFIVVVGTTITGIIFGVLIKGRERS